MRFALELALSIDRWRDTYPQLDPDDPREREQIAIFGRLCAELDATGQLLNTLPMAHPEHGKTVRVRGGKLVVTRILSVGSEVTAGIFEIEPRDEDGAVIEDPDLAMAAAVRIAARCPSAENAYVTIRPVPIVPIRQMIEAGKAVEDSPPPAH